MVTHLPPPISQTPLNLVSACGYFESANNFATKAAVSYQIQHGNDSPERNLALAIKELATGLKTMTNAETDYFPKDYNYSFNTGYLASSKPGKFDGTA